MMALALLAQGILTFHCCKKSDMMSFGAAAGSGVCVDAAVLPQGVPRLALRFKQRWSATDERDNEGGSGPDACCWALACATHV